MTADHAIWFVAGFWFGLFAACVIWAKQCKATAVAALASRLSAGQDIVQAMHELAPKVTGADERKKANKP